MYVNPTNSDKILDSQGGQTVSRGGGQMPYFAPAERNPDTLIKYLLQIIINVLPVVIHY